jgi:hypothetical protein
MRLPDGKIISYSDKEAGVVFLERDDLGQDCNKTTHMGKPVNACEEIVVIRGIVTGEYQVSLHLYSANLENRPGPTAPVQVNIKIEKLNPNTVIVWRTAVIINTIRQEYKLVRFNVNQDATIDGFATDDIPAIVYGTREPNR